MNNKIILKRYQEYLKDPIENIHFQDIDSNINKWNFILIGPKDTPWEDASYEGFIEFGSSFPYTPPIVKFLDIYHPNIYKDGKVCISILHEGIDSTGYEDQTERWTPIHSISSIFLSILTLFHDPNCDSPANVDAAILYRNNKRDFTKYIRNLKS